MAFEILHLLKKVQLDVETDSASATFTLASDFPSGVLAVKYQSPFTTGGARQPVEFVLAGTTRGKLIQATIYLGGAGACRLFGARVLAKALGQPGDNTWTWYPLPVRVTEEAYRPAALPIRPTPDEYAQAGLPIRATSQEYSPAALPIRATPQEYSEGPLPLAQVSPLRQWLTIPVDQLYYNWQERPQGTA